MHRAFSRVIRGTCRKFRENEVPTVAGEEVRKNQDKKEKFVPPSGQCHSLNEAALWTGGLVLLNEFAHHRKSIFSRGCTSSPSSLSENATNSKCPFNSAIAQATKTVGQPLFSSSYSTAACINSSKVQPKSTVLKRGSIDTAPFLTEELLFEDDEVESGIGSRNVSDIVFEEEQQQTTSFFESQKTDKSKKAANEPSKLLVTRIKNTWKSLIDFPHEKKPQDVSVASTAERVSGDILSCLGACQILRGEKSTPITDPPMNAEQLLKEGASLGSSRALYNMGVHYDRKKDFDLAREYYKKASDLGHPLAAYNCAVFTLHDGSLEEGLKLMRYAARNNVREAVEYVKYYNS